jgi:hypothetical protein
MVIAFLHQKLPFIPGPDLRPIDRRLAQPHFYAPLPRQRQVHGAKGRVEIDGAYIRYGRNPPDCVAPHSAQLRVRHRIAIDIAVQNGLPVALPV